MATPLIIVGRHPRRAAASAQRAGYAPLCVTPTAASADLQQLATVHHCPPEQYPAGILRHLGEMPPDAPVLLVGDMENHPEIVDAISFERRLLGCSPEAIRHTRDPLALAGLAAQKGLRQPVTRTHASLTQRLARLVFGVWGAQKYLLKPHASYQGRNIEWWSAGRGVGKDRYLQQYIRGTPCTAVFFADGWSARLLGVTETLVGEAAFHAAGFQVVGHIGPLQLAEKPRQALAHLGVQLAQRFDMRSLFGVDFIMDHRGTLWPIEINPRYVDAVEILERATGKALLTATAPAPLPRAPQVQGCAILRAPRDLAAPQTTPLAASDVADLPVPGTALRKGDRLATLYAAGASRNACESALREKAGSVTTSL